MASQDWLGNFLLSISRKSEEPDLLAKFESEWQNVASGYDLLNVGDFNCDASCLEKITEAIPSDHESFWYSTVASLKAILITDTGNINTALVVPIILPIMNNLVKLSKALLTKIYTFYNQY